MGTCSKVCVIMSAVLIVGFAYFLYTPLPDFIEEQWKYNWFLAKFKICGLITEIGYQLGYDSRINILRWTIVYLSSAYDTDDMNHVHVEDMKIGGVQVRIYKPKSATTGKPLPGLVYFHGGGWTVGHIEQYDSACASFARQSNIVVISVEYRLAPENPFPAGFDDCVTVTLVVLRNGGKYGVDPTKVAVAGDSAGGNLAAGVAIKLRDDKIKPPLKAMIPIYGAFQFCSLSLPAWKFQREYGLQNQQGYIWMVGLWHDLTSPQKTLLESGKFLTPKLQKKCNRLVDYKLLPQNLIQEGYSPDDHTATVVNEDVKSLSEILTDPRVAPLMVEDLKSLPQSMVISAQWDLLRDENIIFARRLDMAGNKVKLFHMPDSFHGVLNCYSDFKTGKKLIDEIVAYLKTTLKNRAD